MARCRTAPPRTKSSIRGPRSPGTLFRSSLTLSKNRHEVPAAFLRQNVMPPHLTAHKFYREGLKPVAEVVTIEKDAMLVILCRSRSVRSLKFPTYR